jgi:hypothetical protein
LFAHEFELEFAHANHFVSTYNGDGVKIVALFSKANLPEIDGDEGGFNASQTLNYVMVLKGLKEKHSSLPCNIDSCFAKHGGM